MALIEEGEGVDEKNQTCNNTIKMQGEMIKKKDVFSELENEKD